MKPAKQAPPPKGKTAAPARARKRDDDAAAVGGLHRRRQGANMKRIGGGRLLVPEEAMRTEGFEFPAEPATPKQEKELSRMIADYLRRDFMHRNQGLPRETLAEALGMKPRNAAYMLALVKKSRASPVAELVVDVMHGMLTGRIAGVLGNRRDARNKWLFKLVKDFDLTEYDLRLRFCYDDDGVVVSVDSYKNNCDQFWKLHAAFRIGYMFWLRRK